jgi:hypothetical protein
MSYLNGLPHCRWNPYVDCTHGKPKGMKIPDWIPHKKCFNCGWNPEVAMERYNQRVQKLEEDRVLCEYINDEFEHRVKGEER